MPSPDPVPVPFSTVPGPRRPCRRRSDSGILLSALRLVPLLALLLLPAVAAAAEPIPLTGRVLDSGGRPVAGVRVELRPVVPEYEQARADLEGRFHPGAVDAGRTGRDGTFRLVAPREGFWSVVASAPRHVSQTLAVGPLELEEGLPPRELPPLTLPEDRGLEVRVLDGAGRPVAGARVGLTTPSRLYWSGKSFQEPERRRALTGDDGRVRLPRAPEEGGLLTVHAEGLAPTEVTLEPGGPARHDVRLAATRPRSVVVEEPGGRGGSARRGGTVSPGAPSPGAASPGPVPPGAASLASASAGAGSAVAGEPAATAAVLLVGEGRLAVGIFGGDRSRALPAPPPGAEGLPLTALAADGRRGRGRLEPVPPAPDRAAGTAVGSGGAPPLAPVALPLEPRLRVSGRVLDPERRGIAGAWIWPAGEPAAGVVRSDGRGGFEIEVAPSAGGDGPAPVWLAADAAGFSSRTLALEDGHLFGERPLTILLEPTAAIRGRVVDDKGEPVAEAALEAVEAGLSRGFRGGGEHAAGGADGTFLLRELAPGTTYRVTARRPGFAPAEREVTAPGAGRVREGVELVLRPGLTAFGTVLDLDEVPVADAVVLLAPVPEGGDPRSWLLARRDDGALRTGTGPDGTWELEDLAPGRYDLRVSARGFSPLEVPGIELAGGRDRADLGTVLLEPGAVLEGAVVDDAGTPLPGARVTARPSDAMAFLRRSPVGEEEPVLTVGDGRFRVEDLVRGRPVDVTVKKEGYVEARVPGVRVPPEEPLVVTLEPASALAGVVVDEAGDPVAGARLGVRGGAASGSGFRRFAHGTTDEEGRFRIEDVPAGEIHVVVNARGFQPLERSGLRVEKGEVLEGQRFVLRAGARVAGRVLDGAGRPLPEARVQLLEDPGSRSPGRFDVTGTDADGRYLLEGIAPGPHSFAAEHDDHVRTVRDLEVVEGENRLDFRLEAGTSISGRVVDEGGAPVAAAAIRARREGARSRSGFADATTDEAGAFLLEGLEPGTYTLTGRKGGFAEAVLEDLRVDAVPVQGIELRLERGARLSGRLLGVELAELAGATVMANPSGVRRLGSLGTVDYEGRYQVEGLSPGDWTVVVSLGEGRPAALEEVTIEPGQQEVYRDIDLGAGFTVSGQVLFGEEPAVGSLVSLVGQEQAEAGFTRADHRGRFEVPGLEAGTYRLQVSGRGGFAGHQEEVEVYGDQEITVRIPVAPVAGRVVSTTGGPLEGAEVHLEAAGGLGGSAPPVSSGGDGRFRFPAVPEGSYRARAEKEGHAPGEVAVEVRDGLPVDGLEIRLEPSGGLVLLLTTPSGRPPERVQAAGFDPAAPPVPGSPPRPVFTESGATGEGGRVRLGRVPAGTWHLRVAGDGSAVQEVTAVVPGPPVPVSLVPGAALAVRVEPLLGTGQLGEVRVLGADGRPFVQLDWGGRPRSTFELTLGRTRVQGLPPGTWTVEATTPAGDRWSATATTVAGAETEVVLE